MHPSTIVVPETVATVTSTASETKLPASKKTADLNRITPIPIANENDISHCNLPMEAGNCTVVPPALALHREFGDSLELLP